MNSDQLIEKLIEGLKEAEAALHHCVKSQIGTENDWSRSTPRVGLESVQEALALAEQWMDGKI